MERLNKYLAQQGYCSRRKADELIAAGNVHVNGVVITEMGYKIDPDTDKVTVSGKKTHKLQTGGTDPVYIILNKPVGYISSTTNSQGESVLDLITPANNVGRNKDLAKKVASVRVYPVGRLDKDSEGLILLTNDGELANKLTHPRYEHEKEYDVILTERLSKDAKKVLEHGMDIGEGEYVQGIRIIGEKNLGKRSVVTAILKEGKNRQIRRMFGRLGYEIITLRRTRIGKAQLGTLPVGKWRVIPKDKIV